MDQSRDDIDGAEGAGRPVGAAAAGQTVMRPTTRLPQGSSSGGAGGPAAADGDGSGKPAGSFAGMGPSPLPDAPSSRRRDIAVALSALIICAIIIGVFAFVERGSAPSAEQIQSDARASLSNPSYGGGPYGSDDPLDLQSVQIREISRTRGGSDPAAAVKVQATLQSASIQDVVEARLDYEHQAGGWALVGAPSGVTHAYKALAGVDQDKVLASLDDVLSKAEASSDSDDGDAASLPTLYGGAQAAVTSESFDKDQQTDELVIHLSSASSFAQRSCDVTAHFRFMAASGQWELSDASVSDGAKALDLSPLIGTWQGTFLTQESSGSKCLAAKDHPLQVEIAKAGDGQIEGTLSCVAHFHGSPEQDQDATDGDEELSDVAFTGKLSQQAGPLSTAAPLTFDCSVQDEARGSLGLTLSFGSADDAGSATARLTSSHVTDTSILFIPMERTDTFADAYGLQKR